LEGRLAPLPPPKLALIPAAAFTADCRLPVPASGVTGVSRPPKSLFPVQPLTLPPVVLTAVPPRPEPAPAKLMDAEAEAPGVVGTEALVPGTEPSLISPDKTLTL